MASGHFPVSSTDIDQAELIQSIKILKSYKSDMRDAVYDLPEADNAASDGACLGYIQIAIELLERYVKDNT